MDQFEKITMTYKCPKALNELQPCHSNWYCDSCQKMVHDFRGMAESQILNIFKQSGQQLCGIYDAHRVKVAPQKTRWYSLASAAALMVGLTACHQKPPIIMGMIRLVPFKQLTAQNQTGKAIANSDRVQHKPIHHKKQVKKNTPGNHTLGLADPGIAIPDSVNNCFVGLAVEVNPEFPGGDKAFQNYINQHLNYKGNFTGRAFYQFTIERDGTLTDIKPMRSGGTELDERVTAVLRQAPRWRPGIQNGRPLIVQYTVPIYIPKLSDTVSVKP